MTEGYPPGLSPRVRARIDAGQVPPPRQYGDPPDDVRDIRFALAVAEDKGDGAAVDRLNLQWIEAMRQGRDLNTWQPPDPGPVNRGPVSSSDYRLAAEKAEEAGNVELALSYRLKAARGGGDIDASTADRARAAEEAGDWQEVDLANAEMVLALRGDPPPSPPPPPPAMPQTNAELAEAARQADVAGDWRQADRYRAAQLGLQRSRQERTVPLDLPAPYDPSVPPANG